MKKVGLIPAAGKGSRLGLPFPKELYPLPLSENYVPVILKNILALKKIDVTDIVIVINYEKSSIMKYLSDGSLWGVNISYVVQDKSISLPNALDKAYQLIRGSEVYFLMADTIILEDDFLIYFEEKLDKNFDISLGCFKTLNPQKFAMVSFNNEIVTSIIEKPVQTDLEYMWGLWHWNESFTEELHNKVLKIESKNEQTLSEIAINFVNNNQIQFIDMQGYSYWDIGTYKEINKFIIEMINK